MNYFQVGCMAYLMVCMDISRQRWSNRWPDMRWIMPGEKPLNEHQVSELVPIYIKPVW